MELWQSTIIYIWIFSPSYSLFCFVQNDRLTREKIMLMKSPDILSTLEMKPMIDSIVNVVNPIRNWTKREMTFFCFIPFSILSSSYRLRIRLKTLSSLTLLSRFKSILVLMKTWITCCNFYCIQSPIKVMNKTKTKKSWNSM